ncbi:hypothetical protein VTN96DRAFT_5182 [Rasamsonia emersonii]
MTAQHDPSLSSLPRTLPTDLQDKMSQYGQYNLDNAKFCLYALTNNLLTENDLGSICASIKTIYAHNVLAMPEEEIPDFISPAPDWSSLTEKFLNLGDILSYHVRDLDKGWKPSAGNNAGELEWYPFDFVVVTGEKKDSWKSDGLVVVHCEPEDDGPEGSSWTVDSCRMRVENLGMALEGLREHDSSFSDLKAQFGI